MHHNTGPANGQRYRADDDVLEWEDAGEAAEEAKPATEDPAGDDGLDWEDA